MRKMIDWIKRARLEDWIRLIDKLIPHAVIVASGMFVVFFLIDRVNTAMEFMTNEFHKRLTLALALMAIYLAVRRIATIRKSERDGYKRRLKQYKSGKAAK